MLCKHCNETNFANRGIFLNHLKFCIKNPKFEQNLENARNRVKNARSSITKEHREKSALKIKGKKLSDETKKKISLKSKGRLHSEKTKALISEKRKSYLSLNPEKHPWKLSSKFKSAPCELLKKKLRDQNLIFEEEFSPSKDRHFSLDIAFPDKKLCFEINGEQHYNRDGSLKTYYQDREIFLKEIGWNVIQIHYSECFSETKIDQILDHIRGSSNG